MKLSEVHQELFDSVYPDGYKVKAGEEGHFHIMYVDIISNKGARSIEKAIIQKYFPKEWEQSKKTIENYGVTVTGHNEYAVIHDPTAKAEEAKV